MTFRRWQDAILFLLMLSLGACNWFGGDESETASAESESEQLTEQQKTVRNFIGKMEEDPEIEKGVRRELERAALSDPTMDPDPGSRPLEGQDAEYARMGLESDLVKNTEDVQAAALELGKITKDALGIEKIVFSDKEEFRCQAVEANEKGFKEEILVSRPFYGSVALLRLRTKDSPIMDGVLNFTVGRRIDEGAYVYSHEPETLFRIDSAANATPGSTVRARLDTQLGGHDWRANFDCVRGAEE